jgi:hypothetical protein
MTNATERAPFAEWLAGLTDHDKEDFLRQWYEAECAPREAQPDGWKLVPVEPTDAMLEEITLIKGFTERAMVVRYKAMLDAAPTPERADADTAGAKPWFEHRAADGTTYWLHTPPAKRADAEKDAALTTLSGLVHAYVGLCRDSGIDPGMNTQYRNARAILAANTEKQS